MCCIYLKWAKSVARAGYIYKYFVHKRICRKLHGVLALGALSSMLAA